VRLGAANRALERLGVPWRFGEAKRGEVAVRGTGVGSTFDGVTASLRYTLIPRSAERADTLATAAGEPWIVSGARYVIIASPLTPEATTFPVRAAFVPWLGDVLSQRLGTESGAAAAAAPHAMVARPAGADALELPGGQQLPLPDDSLAAPDRPGTYFYLHGGRRTGALVVNPEPEESDLTRLDLATLGSRIRARDVRALDDSEQLQAGIFASAPRRSISIALLLVALAALIAESAVAGGAHRRSAS
jgi:hypothetical protein